MPEAREFYCGLYVNSAESREALRSQIAEAVGGKMYLCRVYNEHIDLELVKNEVHDPQRMGEHAGFLYYPHRAEILPKADDHEEIDAEDQAIYKDMLVRVIIALRKSGAQVVAACDFEDLIVERTGWNWSETTPHHPPVADGA